MQPVRTSIQENRRFESPRQRLSPGRSCQSAVWFVSSNVRVDPIQERSCKQCVPTGARKTVDSTGRDEQQSRQSSPRTIAQ